MTVVNTNPKPIGVIDALSVGYRIVARAWAIWVVPLALDLFFWLGPQVTPWAAITHLLSRLDPEVRTLVEQAVGLQETDLSQLTGPNMLALLSLGPGGPNTLAGTLGQLPAAPVLRPVIAITSPWALLGLMVGLLFLSGPISGLYLTLAARGVAGTLEEKTPGFLRAWGWTTAHIVIYTLLWAAFLGSMSIAISLAMVLALFVSPALATAVATLGLFLLSWLLILLSFFLYFTPAAIALRQVPLWQAIVRSARVVWRYFWSSLGLMLVSLLIAEGFALIWQRLFGSWPGVFLALVGNAYLSSGLTVAGFIFFHERDLVLGQATQREDNLIPPSDW